MRTKIVLTIISLILTTTPAIFAQQTADTNQPIIQAQPTDTLHPKILEERLKHLGEIMQIQFKHLQEKVFFRLEGHLRETEFREQADRRRWELILGVVMFLLSSFGVIVYRTVVKRTRETIEAKVDLELEKSVAGFKDRAEAEVDRILAVMTSKREKMDALEKEGKEYLSAMDSAHAELRVKGERLITELTAKAVDLGKKLPEETARELAEYTDELPGAKKEDEYSAEDWYLKAADSHQADDFEPAVEYYTRAIELRDDYYEALFNRASALHSLQQYGKAIDGFSKCIGLNPQDAFAYSNRGVSRSRASKYDEALKDHNHAVKVAPEVPDLYYNRAGTLWHMKKFSESLKDADKAVELAPFDAHGHSSRANALFGLKEYVPALEAIKKAIGMDERDVTARLIAIEYSLVAVGAEIALSFAQSCESLTMHPRQKALCLYFRCIAERLATRDTMVSERELEILLTSPMRIEWSFDEFEDWVKTADIPEDARKFIIEKTELMKKKQG